ncbi:MAG: bifunctional UDP-N-acetylmuramoyl-tripeptide:D-alanyl-D-alanine ligase/alanine racemase [Bacteroidales bacterium]|nr:bifunctional UDP-N-acetylmuramoyl-tripeptide:D-alanyl-D-alanine ligase/alanine racemase [Bacteroidales bacterium]
MFTIGEIASYLADAHSVLPRPADRIAELAFDSRRIALPEQSLFFAIRTEKNDGHRYIASLVESGVRNFVITDGIESYSQFADCNFIQVKDAVAALQHIAAEHRRRFSIPVIGITGSNGKTIVKEWLSLMLADDYHVVKNPNSYNSQIGVPCSVWQMRQHHDMAIFEAGISKPGEMARLEEIIQPTIGILTNIGAAHAQYFTDDREKLTEKLKLFAHAEKLIYCCDNQLIEEELQKPLYHHLQKISWGVSSSARHQIKSQHVDGHHTLVEIDGETYNIPFTDSASVENALQTIMLMRLLDFSAAQINRKLARLTSLSMRLEIKEAINQSILINDTYSLDRNSLNIALDFLASQRQYVRRTLFLSDFDQAGILTRENYEELNNLLINNQITKLIAVGPALFEHRNVFHIDEQYFFQTTEEALQHLPEIIFQQEAILIKGARKFRFEQFVDQLHFKTHCTVLQVSLPAIIHNLNYYRSLLKPETKMTAMVKALSYGLGDAELINELQYHNIDYLAVAYTDEGVNLRKRKIKNPIIVLGAEAHSFEMMIHHRLEPEIFNFHYLRELINTLALHPEITEFKIHIKLDTGMHRLGFVADDIEPLAQLINEHPALKVASVFSHLAAAEDPAEDEFTLSQIRRFDEMSQQLLGHFNYPIMRHILNSAGISRFSQYQFDMVRLGLGLYGFSYVEKDLPYLQNTVSLQTVVTQIKRIAAGETVGYNRTYRAAHDMTIGIIPIGYADGFFREFSNGVGCVSVRGRKVPIIGKICMDMCMIDLTGLAVEEGEPVVVYGDENPVSEMAAAIGKTPYELLTAISKRVPRIYIKD